MWMMKNFPLKARHQVRSNVKKQILIDSHSVDDQLIAYSFSHTHIQHLPRQAGAEFRELYLLCPLGQTGRREKTKLCKDHSLPVLPHYFGQTEPLQSEERRVSSGTIQVFERHTNEK